MVQCVAGLPASFMRSWLVNLARDCRRPRVCNPGLAWQQRPRTFFGDEDQALHRDLLVADSDRQVRFMRMRNDR